MVSLLFFLTAQIPTVIHATAVITEMNTENEILNKD